MAKFLIYPNRFDKRLDMFMAPAMLADVAVMAWQLGLTRSAYVRLALAERLAADANCFSELELGLLGRKA